MTSLLKNDQATYPSKYSTRFSLRESKMSQTSLSDKATEQETQPKSYSASSVQPFDSYHRQDSPLTSASDSTDSSPTGTDSITGDSSTTEMSPGTSPESPIGKPSAFAIGQMRAHILHDGQVLPTSTAFFDLQRPTTPGKKPRNLKNLAVNTTGALGKGRAASTTSLPAFSMIETITSPSPPTQSFAKPSSPPRRRPSNLALTITTQANSKPLPNHVRLAIPPTPSLSRPNALRHFQSSPSLPLQPPRRTIDSPPSLIVMGSRLSPEAPSDALKNAEDEPNFDIPQSKEEQPEAYPDGPICVYEPYIDLYLEPSTKQAMDYDVVLNVASEVRNPFVTSKVSPSPEPDIVLDGGGGIRYGRRNFLTPGTGDTAALSPVLEARFLPTPQRIAFRTEEIDSSETPEYIHIPWEHNTDIVPDLLRLVKLIDERVRDGKRVLVHCQCGVSRSATLVVAYGLYKDPSMSVQEAYEIVKRRSKWIGPNMNLIMQLQEFRSNLTGVSRRGLGLRSLTPVEPSRSWSEWRGSNMRSGVAVDASIPQTAPLMPGASLGSHLTSPQLTRAVSPGPSSAPSGLAWPSPDDQNERKDSKLQQVDVASVNSAAQVVSTVQVDRDLKPHVGAFTNRVPSLALNLDSRLAPGPDTAQLPPLLSPRSEEFAMTPLQPSPQVASEDRFGLMSPTTTEFAHSPFDRAGLLGALGMGPAHPQTASPGVASSSSPSTAESAEPHGSAPDMSPPSESEHPAAQDENKRSLWSRGVQNINSYHHDDALMSPRVTEFTQSPFALTEPAEVLSASAGGADPRSPPSKGAHPITKNIADVL